LLLFAFTMHKKGHYLLFYLFFAATIPAIAQNTDSLKRVQDQRRTDSLKRVDDQRRADSLRRADSIKIDTNVLNRYRIAPRRNAIPLRMRPFQIMPELIPTTMMDYKVSYWRKWIVFGINVSQSGFSNNWSGGGNNAIAVLGNFDYKTEYNRSPFDYTSELILMYGKSRNTGQTARKTNDRIFLDNKIATQLSKKWYFFGSLDFESQFDAGYQYTESNGTLNSPLLISKFMSPGYLTESVGFEFKPSKAFDLRIGTGTARQTFVLDTSLYHNIPTNYGVAHGHTFLNQLAFQLVSTFDKNIMPNVHLNARYALFVPYGQSIAYITHRLDVTLAAQVNKLVNVTINGSGVYDKNASGRIQGFEGLALGILYKFP